MPKIEELEELVNKFEDRVKVVGLMNEKRFAELELKIGELNQKINEVTTDFPKIKERAVEVEDLLNVVNLGLVEYKDNFDKIDSNVSKYEKIPETLEAVRTNLESKMRELNDSVSNLTANVEVLKSLKEDIIKNAEESISSKFKTVEDGIERNKVEVEHVKRDLDGFSVALRSFERTIEITNLDDIIRRFDSLDRRIANNELELEKFRGFVPDISITVCDVEILKKKLKEMSSSVMDVLSRMNEFEINISKKMSLFDVLAKKAESNVDTNQIEDINRLKIDVEGIKSDLGKVYTEVSEKVSNIAITDDINKLKLDVEELKLSKPNLNEMVANIKNEIITEVKNQLPQPEGQFNTIPSIDLDEKIANLREKVENIEKSIVDINKPKFDYQKPVESRILNVDNVIKEIPKNIIDEITSLKDIISRFSSENNDLKKVIRDIRLNQMDSISTDMFIGVSSRISTIEKKLSEIEEEMSKMRDQ